MGLFKTEVEHLESRHHVSVSRTPLRPHGDPRDVLSPASLCPSGLAGDRAIRPFQGPALGSAPLSACELHLGLEQRFSESGPWGGRGTQERVREAGSQGPPSQSGGSLESGAGPSSPYGSESPGDAPAQQSMKAPDLEYNFGICLESRHSKEPSCASFLVTCT